MLKLHFVVCVFLMQSCLFWSQNQGANSNSTDVLRGPQNALPNGVVDGVVVKDELPVRSKVEYEHVRLADYVWSKRIFSRIDSREKVNHPLFFPFDKMDNDYFTFPTNDNELNDRSKWIRQQDRYSLWTIIEMHLMKGDLRLYRVNSTEEGVGVMEDGYQLKYPIARTDKTDFYTNKNNYRTDVGKFLTVGGKKTEYELELTTDAGGKEILRKGKNQTFSQWVASLLDVTNVDNVSDLDDPDNPGKLLSKYDQLNAIKSDPKLYKELEDCWNSAPDGGIIEKPAKVAYINSRSITAYNIKEDWFFDKERSMLDKRIIAIAPVGYYSVPIPKDRKEIPEPLDRYTRFLLMGENGSLQAFTDKGLEDVVPNPDESIEQREMFWLYFPELRNVMVNYYVYNNQSDAQWMSFDDFFWKRSFSAQIYKATDQFDRDIEDYRYGVDALYEAQKIKESMRTWETDLWNY